MPRIEIEMSYEEILARKTKVERDLADINFLIQKQAEKQAELIKWSQLEEENRPQATKNPLDGLPSDSDLLKEINK